MSSLPPPPAMVDAASPSLSTTILLALATALVLPLLLVALGASVSALWKEIKAELAPVQAPVPRRKKTNSSSSSSSVVPKLPKAAAAAQAPPPAEQAKPPSQRAAPAAAAAPVHPAQAVMRALNDPTLQVRVSGLLTRNPPGGGALFRGELMDGSGVAVFAARRPVDVDGGSSPSKFSIPPLLGAGAAHPNVAQLFAVRETLVPGGCGAASGALLPPARRGCWGTTNLSSSSTTAVAPAANVDGPLSLAAALAAAGAPLPDRDTSSSKSSSSSASSSSSSSAPAPEIETVAVYELCERGTLRAAIRAWAATAAAEATAERRQAPLLLA